jgi:hypothetical protein
MNIFLNFKPVIFRYLLIHELNNSKNLSIFLALQCLIIPFITLLKIYIQI